MRQLLRPLRLLMPALLLGSFASHGQALNYTATGASTVVGTYTDLGTTGTAIATANTDDANSTAQPIGFTFNFNGTAFTQFVLNTNGFLKLGATPPSAAAMFLPPSATSPIIDPFQSTNAADVNIIAPFNVDLTAGNGTGGAEYRVATSGTAPNQVCTIQWKNVADKTGGQFANFSFQVKLYQTTNNIDFVYDAPVASAAAPAFQFSQVGIKGSGFAADQFVQALKQSAAAWSAATFANSITGTTLNTLNYRNNVNPVAGTTYRFTPSAANDAEVSAIYTLGTASSTFSSPHVVQAAITNVGSAAKTSFTATLTVSGATTFTATQTIATLAVGASTVVTFPGYNLVAGTNTVTVSITPDAVTSNDSRSETQVVTTGDISYFTPTFTAYTSGIGSNTTANTQLFAKYTINGAATVTAITAAFPNAGTATDTYQLLIYDATGTGGLPGAVLYTSPTRTKPTTAGSTTLSGISVPVSGSFYVAIKQLTTSNIGLGFLSVVPGRPNTFYVSSNGTTFTDLSSPNGLPSRLALSATLAAAGPVTCAPVTALAAGSITNTGASITFTAPAGATAYTVTYTAAGGQPVTVTPAVTASPVTLTGLTPGTAYTVSVTNNCGGTNGNSTAVTTTFTTTGTVPGPANDDCSGAVALTVGATCTPITSTNNNATASTGVPAPTVGGSGCFVAGTPITNDVWFSVVVPANGAVTVTTSAITGSPLVDTGLVLYSGTCANLTEIGCSDDASAATLFSSATVVGLTAGSTIYARVWSFGTTPTGQFGICAVTATPPPPPPANDNPTGAITLTVTPTCTPTNGTNVGATTTTPNGYVNPSTTPSTCGVAINPRDVWYKFVATAATATVTVTGNPAGLVRVFSAATAAGPFTQVSCTASTANNTVAPALPLTGLTAGTTYYISVSGYGSGDTQGAFTICVTGTSANAPVTGVTIGNITTTSASVTFTAPTGTPAPTGYTVTLTPTMPGGLPIVVNGTGSPIVIPNLSPNTTYTVTVVANYTGGGSSAPANATFTTPMGSSTTATIGNGVLSVYPNPAQQRFTLSLPAVAGARTAELTMTNAIGQRVFTRTVTLQADGTQVALEADGLATGLYTLRVQAGGQTAAIKVAISR